MFFTGIVRGIAMRKQEEKMLKKEKDMARDNPEGAGVMHLVIDSMQRVSLINKKGCEVLGYKEKNILGKNWFKNFIPKKIRNESGAVFKELIAGKTTPLEYFKAPVLTKKGKEKIIAWHNTVLKDKEGAIIGVLSSGEDISGRMQAEETLQRDYDELKIRIEELSKVNEFLQTKVNERRQIEYARELAELAESSNKIASISCPLFKGIEKLIDIAADFIGPAPEINKKGINLNDLFAKGGSVYSGEEGIKGIYGLSMRNDAGGKLIIETFGNIKKTPEGLVVKEDREPLTEVLNKEHEIVITAEIPGIGDEGITVSLKGDMLEFFAAGKGRRYHKKILLPAKGEDKTLNYSYENGVLEFRIK